MRVGIDPGTSPSTTVVEHQRVEACSSHCLGQVGVLFVPGEPMKEHYGRVNAPALGHIKNPVHVDASAGDQYRTHHWRVGGVDRAGVGSYRGRAACHFLCVERAKPRDTNGDEEACCVAHTGVTLTGAVASPGHVCVSCQMDRA